MKTLNKVKDFSQETGLKVAILSDTHEELADPVGELVKTCDLAIHAGDIGCYSVLESLQPLSGNVFAVAGNNDKPYLWDFSEWNIVKNLPHTLYLQLPGGKLAVEHGHKHDMHRPSHDDLRNAHPTARLVVYGHTHIQVIDKDDPDCWVVNPGAAGHTRNKGGPSCIILTANQDDWQLEYFKFAEK